MVKTKGDALYFTGSSVAQRGKTVTCPSDYLVIGLELTGFGIIGYKIWYTYISIHKLLNADHQPDLDHGLRKIKAPLWKRFRQSVNARRKDIRGLIAAVLYLLWAGTRDNPGRWGVWISKATFYRNLHEQGFTLRRPALVPRLSEENIYQRTVFAETELSFIEANTVPHYLQRIIFLDSACFAMRPGTCIDAADCRLVTDTKSTVWRTYSLPKETTSFEAIGAVAKGFRAPLYFVKEFDPTKNNKPGANFVRRYIIDHVIKLAANMRKRLGLGAQELIYIVMDSAKCQQANSVINLLEANHIHLVGLSPKTPECNIIEPVWSLTKTALRGTWTEDDDPARFFAAVRKAYNGLDQRKIDGLCDSYEARVRALLEAKGQHFKFQGSRRPALMGIDNDDDLEVVVEDSDDEEPVEKKRRQQKKRA